MRRPRSAASGWCRVVRPDRAASVARSLRLSLLTGEFIRYGFCSALALACDMAVLLVMVHVVGLHYQLAAALGFSLGLVVAYVTSVRYAFRTRRLENRSAEFTGFVIIGLLGLLLTQGLLHVMVEGLSLPVGIAKILTAGFVFMFNFSARRLTLFAGRGAP
ncbi:MAG: GtrA family protein [Hyphomicrobiales bacterium]|nr:GtrA family protein [Hyphomicrobiales bacterium]